MRVGIDLIEIPRIQFTCEKYGDRFTKRILTESEIEYCAKKNNPYESIAVRFAAKEAFAKAIGSGISSKVQWHDVEVAREMNGKPLLKLHREFSGISSEKISLSLSHTHQYAIAIVIIEP